MNSISIEKKGRRIELRSRVAIAGLRTAVPGAYQSVNGHWTVPLSIESCILLRQKYGTRLDVGPTLRRWARGVQRNRRNMAALSASKDAKLYVLPKVAPKLYRAMRKRKYQRVGVRFIADNPATLEADEPGLGKTLIAMGGILESETPGPYLIIAPKTASDSVWKREIERWLPRDHKAIIVPEGRIMRERVLKYSHFGPKTWLIVHPEMVMVRTWLECVKLVKKRFRSRKTGRKYFKTVPCGKWSPAEAKQKRILKTCKHVKDRKTKRIDVYSYEKLFKVQWGAIVIDESHESLIRRSGAPTQRRNGMDKLPIRTDGLRIAMSGTPFDDRPHQLWGTLNWLYPDKYSAFYRWAETYWKKTGYTGWGIGEFIKEREQMLWDSLSTVAIRRTKAEVAQDLPPKMYPGSKLDPWDEQSPHGIWLEMEGKQARAYAQMERDAVAELDSGRLTAVTGLAELTRLKQLACSYGRIETKKVRVRCGATFEDHRLFCDECKRRGWHIEWRDKFHPELPSNKFNWLANSLEEWGFPRRPITKVVVVSFYTGLLENVASNLERHFKTKPHRPLTTAITGRVTGSRRKRVIDEFNDDGGPSVMMLNVKAGGTAITIDSADKTIFLSETRIPSQQTQAEDRTHRVSKPRHCEYFYLRSLGTVDVGTAWANMELAEGSRRLLDVRRGVEYLQHVIDLSN